MPRTYNRGTKPLPSVHKPKKTINKKRVASKKSTMSNALSIMRLQKDVRKLKVAEFGQKTNATSDP